MRRLLLIIIFLQSLQLLFFPVARGQYKFEKAVHFNTEHGLPDNEVRWIKKGEDGFMWVGTTGGLARFDGLRFKSYKHDPNNPHSISGDQITSLLPLKDSIWVGTSNGLSILDVKSDKFTNYQFSEKGKADSFSRSEAMLTTALFRDRQGEIWFGTRFLGVGKYLPDKDDFKFYSYQEDNPNSEFLTSDGSKSVLSIEQSRTNDSIIWAGTLIGLLSINKYTGKVDAYRFTFKNKDYQAGANMFRRIYHHDDGLLYVGGWRQGLMVFDPVTKSLNPVRVKDDALNELLKNVISNISRKSKDEIWITSTNGLAIYHTGKKEITFSRFNDVRAGKFYGVDFVDEDNRVWTSTINGVHLFDPVIQQFDNYSFQHQFNYYWGFIFYILPDAKGNMLTVCPRLSDGIYFFDKNSQTYQKVPFKELSSLNMKQLTVRGFTRTHSGDFVLSTETGLYGFSMERKQLFQYPFQPELMYRRFGEVLWDRNDRLWLCADHDGLIRWDPKTKTSRTFKQELKSPGAAWEVASLSSIFEDSRGNIWVKRNGGYSVYISAKDTILNFLYSVDTTNSLPFVYTFAESVNGQLWMNGHDGWLAFADIESPEKGIIKKFKIDQQSPSEWVNKLAAAPDGNIWGYTEERIIKINSLNQKISSYSFQYGIDGPDFYQFIVTPSGELAFGGRNNIVIANPADLVRNIELPVPYITEVQVLQKPYTKGFSMFGGEKLSFNHWQNFFSIGFSAQVFTLAKKVRFRYRLQGFDDWTEAKERRFANYTNVPSGKYTFQLQVANNEGTWNAKILELPVWVATPWWNTWWFQVGALFAVVTTIYMLYRYRIGQIRNKERLRTEFEKKLANVEMSALLSQMNPHFLFNCLNSIDSYIIRNESTKASEYLNNFARLIRLIFQNSRSNYISLKDELETLDLYLQMESLRFRNKFSYEICVDQEVDPSSIDIPPMLIQPYVENAIWHGLMHKSDATERRVALNISRDNGRLVCVIQDNGIGREKAQEIKAKRPSPNGKKSMGMQITKDRIEMINKMYNSTTTVNVIDLKEASGEAAGTRVELTIPV
jgi:ligand-binding sensor domain-containing protein